MNEVIRKLDGLGRIVLPIEYRSILKIKNNSKVKISLKENYIKVEKYSEMNKKINDVSDYQKILKNALNIDFVLTDLEEIIDNKEIVDSDLLNIIKYGKVSVLNNNNDLIFNTENKINFIVIPVKVYGEVIGSLIGYTYEREISEYEKNILEIVQLILNKNIED